MTSLADRTIVSLRSLHDELAALVATLTDDQLTGRSGATEWTIAQVLSHLGSGSEISLASVQAAVNGTQAPEGDFNQGVWDRWNAMSPQDQASGFLEHDETLVETIEALTPEQRENLKIKIFMPSPLGVAAVAGLRLNEVALHSWDVRVALDPTATVSDDDATVLLDQFAGELGFLLGFVGKPEALAQPAVVDANGYGLLIGDGIRLTPEVFDATATLTSAPDAVIRLISGRLTPAFTPDSVHVEGNLSLEDLRRVFPGF